MPNICLGLFIPVKNIATPWDCLKSRNQQGGARKTLCSHYNLDPNQLSLSLKSIKGKGVESEQRGLAAVEMMDWKGLRVILACPLILTDLPPTSPGLHPAVTLRNEASKVFSPLEGAPIGLVSFPSSLSALPCLLLHSSPSAVLKLIVCCKYFLRTSSLALLAEVVHSHA